MKLKHTLIYCKCRIRQSKEAGIRTLVALDDQGGKNLKWTNILRSKVTPILLSVD